MMITSQYRISPPNLIGLRRQANSHFQARFASTVCQSSTDALLDEHARQIQIANSASASLFPQGFKDTFPQTKVAVLGTGSIYRDSVFNVEQKLDFLIGNASQRYLFDPALKPNIPGERLASLEAIPKGSIALVLSPSGLHTEQITKLIANPNVSGIYCEKPMATSQKQLDALDAVVRSAQKPIYFADYYYFQALPLLAVMGKPSPYKNFLQVDSTLPASHELETAIKQGKPILGKITGMEGKWIFGPWKPGDLLFDGRKWLAHQNQGGGITLDLFVHVVNLMNLLQLKMNPASESSMLALDKSLSKLVSVAQTDPNHAEIRGHVKGSLENKAPYDFEYGLHNHESIGYLILKGENGRKLKMPLIYQDGKDKVELLDADDKVIGRVSLPVHPYLLMMHHAFHHLSSESKAPLFYPEQKAALKWIFDAKTKAGMQP